MHTEFRSEKLKGRESEDLGVGVRIILEQILRTYGGKVCTGFI